MSTNGGSKRVLRRLLAGIAVASAATVATAGPASAHFLGYDSVDSREIRFDESTKYDTELSYARSEWNSVGSVDFKWDSWDTYENVHFNDSYRSDVTWVGLYSNEWGTDEIYFNKYYLDSYSFCRRLKTVKHEMGHALGLAHSYYPQIMQQGDVGHCSLQSHDKSDYHALWG